MRRTYDECLQAFLSPESATRMSALDDLLTLEDLRAAKCLDALADDPDAEIALKVRKSLTLRSGEALDQKWAVPDFRQLGVAGSLAASAGLLARFPLLLLAIGVASFVVVFGVGSPILFAELPLFIWTRSASESIWFFAIAGMLVSLNLPHLTAGMLAWALNRKHLGEPVSIAAAFGFARSRAAALSSTYCRRIRFMGEGLLVGFVLFNVAYAALVVAMICARQAASQPESLAAIAMKAGQMVSGALAASIGLCAVMRPVQAYYHFAFADLVSLTQGLGGEDACRQAQKVWLTKGALAGRFLIAVWLLASSSTVALVSALGWNLFVLVPVAVLLNTWIGLAQVVIFYGALAAMAGSEPTKEGESRSRWREKLSLGPADAVVALPVALFLLIGGCYEVSRPNTESAAIREKQHTRACYMNQKIIAGAIEMYNLDHPKQSRTLGPELMRAMAKQGYLQSPPDDPGEGSDTSGNYVPDRGAGTGGVTCKVHGSIPKP